MKGDPKVIRHLNSALTNQMTAAHQALLHAGLFRHWGLVRLAEPLKLHAAAGLATVDRLIERVFDLEGHPNLQDLHKLKVGEDAPEILNAELAAAAHHRGNLQLAVAECEAAKDYPSRTVLLAAMEATEAQIIWLETRIDLIQRLGLIACQQEWMRS